MKNINVLHMADAYKLSHKGLMPNDLEYIYSNMTPRGAKHFPSIKGFYDNKVVFFGLQYFIKNYLIDIWNTNFFQVPKEKVIAKFKRRTDNYLGKDSVSTGHFEELHDLGYLPISIKALPEGTLSNIGVPFLTIVNTHPKFGWLTNYLETILSCELWKPIVNATLAREFYRVLTKFTDETCDNHNLVPFQIHGFEFRGMSGLHDAAINAAATLLYSCGTDTIPGIDLLEDYYNANVEKEFVANSCPASEHSTASLGTSMEGELEFFRRAITEYYPKGIVSLVSDTFDYFRVITEFATILKNDILNRKVNELGLAKVVFRPDSGDPVKIIVGDPDAPVGSPEYKGSIQCLWDIFGGTINSKGYKELNPRVGLIYGDSITLDIAYRALEGLKAKGFAANNLVMGVGSFSRTFLTRDSLNIAQKATWAQVNGKGYELFKAPKTDSGMKKSAKGLLRVDKINGEYVLKDCCTPEEEAGGELVEVFRDGKLLVDHTLAEIRARIKAG